MAAELIEFAAGLARADDPLRGRDPFLERLRAAALEAGLPPIWLAPEALALASLVLEASGAREVLELGTLAGSSAIALARRLPGPPRPGRVRTVEADARHAAFAREWIARSDVAERVELIEGRALEVLATLAERSLDALLVDADKQEYEAYLEQSSRVLRPGGWLFVDNAFAFGRLLDPACEEPEVAAIRRFDERLARDPGFDALLVPVGDGLWAARRR